MLIHLLFLYSGLIPQIQRLDEVIVSFEVSHMGALRVEGKFTNVAAEITRVSSIEWKIDGEVDVFSIDTDNNSRDETLITEQYLNAEEFPVIPFQAQIIYRDKKKLVVIDLKIRGIETQLLGELVEEDGILISKPMVLNRKEIGLDFGLMDSLIGNEVTIVIDSGIELSELD